MKPASYLTEIMKNLAAMGAHDKTNPDALFGKLYLMTSSESDGVVWKGEVTKEVAFQELLRDLLTEEIQENLFKFVRFQYVRGVEFTCIPSISFICIMGCSVHKHSINHPVHEHVSRTVFRPREYSATSIIQTLLSQQLFIAHT